MKKTTEEIQAAPTEDEIAIRKYAKDLEGRKHIDAIDLAKNFMFPLLRKLAKTAGDVEERVADTEESLEALDGLVKQIGGGVNVEMLEDAKDLFIKVAEHLDETLVLAGFFTVDAKGMQPTAKYQKEHPAHFLKQQEIVSEMTEFFAEMAAAINAGGGGDDDDAPGGDGVPDDGEPTVPNTPPTRVVAVPAMPVETVNASVGATSASTAEKNAASNAASNGENHGA